MASKRKPRRGSTGHELELQDLKRIDQAMRAAFRLDPDVIMHFALGQDAEALTPEGLRRRGQRLAGAAEAVELLTPQLEQSADAVLARVARGGFPTGPDNYLFKFERAVSAQVQRLERYIEDRLTFKASMVDVPFVDEMRSARVQGRRDEARRLISDFGQRKPEVTNKVTPIKKDERRSDEEAIHLVAKRDYKDMQDELRTRSEALMRMARSSNLLADLLEGLRPSSNTLSMVATTAFMQMQAEAGQEVVPPSRPEPRRAHRRRSRRSGDVIAVQQKGSLPASRMSDTRPVEPAAPASASKTGPVAADADHVHDPSFIAHTMFDAENRIRVAASVTALARMYARHAEDKLVPMLAMLDSRTLREIGAGGNHFSSNRIHYRAQERLDKERLVLIARGDRASYHAEVATLMSETFGVVQADIQTQLGLMEANRYSPKRVETSTEVVSATRDRVNEYINRRQPYIARMEHVRTRVKAEIMGMEGSRFHQALDHALALREHLVDEFLGSDRGVETGVARLEGGRRDADRYQELDVIDQLTFRRLLQGGLDD